MNEIVHNRFFKLGKKNQNANHDSIEGLLPGDDFDYGETYNPFNYCYNLVLEELNMEVTVKFLLDEYDRTNLQPITFKDKEGKEHTIPFFPTVQTGHTNYNINPNMFHNEWEEDERKLSVIPSIVRAKVFGNGIDTKDVLVTEDIVQQHVTPDRLLSALMNFYYEIKEDPKAPTALMQLIKDIVYPSDEDFDDEYEDF